MEASYSVISFFELFRPDIVGFSSDSFACSFIVPKSICEVEKRGGSILEHLLDSTLVHGLRHWLWEESNITLPLERETRGY